MYLFRSLALCLGVFLLGSAPAALAADRVALVIGNGEYKNANALPNPPRDARAIASALRDINFEVLEGEDLDRVGMERLLRDFLRKATGAKVALFFYAGHGMEVDGQNYLVPVDAALEAPSDLSFETVGMSKILDNLNDPNRANIIILDACRNNPLARSFRARVGSTRSVSPNDGLAGYSDVGTGTLIALATAPGHVALDGDGANSPFTTGLLKHIRQPGLEVRQMLTRVRRDVLEATGDQQQPWDNSSLLGDVYLAGSPQTAQNTSASKPKQTASLEDNNQTSSALSEAEKLRKLREQTAAELEKMRQANAELEKARKEAEAAARQAAQQHEEAQKSERSAALLQRNDPATRPRKETTNPRNKFAAVAISKTSLGKGKEVWGAGYNYNTQKSAEQRALDECGKYAKDCEVVYWARNACISLSLGTNAWGAAWNTVLKEAERESVRQCGKYGKNCKVTYSVCSYAQ